MVWTHTYPLLVHAVCVGAAGGCRLTQGVVCAWGGVGGLLGWGQCRGVCGGDGGGLWQGKVVLTVKCLGYFSISSVGQVRLVP